MIDDITKNGYLHILSIKFLPEGNVDLREVVMQFDAKYYVFDIGRYRRMDVEQVTGMKLNNRYYNIDFFNSSRNNELFIYSKYLCGYKCYK